MKKRDPNDIMWRLGPREDVRVAKKREKHEKNDSREDKGDQRRASFKSGKGRLSLKLIKRQIRDEKQRRR